MFNLHNIQTIILISIAFLIFAISASAQTTTFTYQGKLSDASVPQPTNGTYEMEFKAFDAAVGGNQFASAITLPSVQVVNGIFTVQLDFGALTFRGQDVFLDIGVRPFSDPNPFTALTPRQSVASAPYSIQSLNSINALHASDSANLGNVPASGYVLTGDVRLADARDPTAGSTNYVQNQNAAVQPAANFNISGTGSADAFNAATQFNIGGNRVLSVKGSVNLFAGANAGTSNTGGNSNTFVGSFSGNANANGVNNSFLGTDSGRNNQANNNSFFGRSSGFANLGGANNSFFGLDAGRFNVAGNNNAFFGYGSGANNLSDSNSFFGFQSGVGTTSGSGNSFFGLNAGSNNTIGSFNTMLGNGANVTANNLTFATAIGAGALVSTSNTIVLGTASTSTEIPGTIKVFTLGSAGATTLCRNAASQIADCAGSGGGSFIQNSTVLQPTADFNISGGGTLGGTLSANSVNSATNFRIANTPVFSTPNVSNVVAGQSTNHALLGSDSSFYGYKAGESSGSLSQANTFIGSSAGRQTTSGDENTFVGRTAGYTNSIGSFNSFYGSGAGYSNNVDGNSFFGYRAGYLSNTGLRNSIFGYQAGQTMQNVSDNSVFGYEAGKANFSGIRNAFFGGSSGLANNSGSDNAFFGHTSGAVNTTGIRNTIVGSNGGFQNTTQSQNTLIGFQTGGTGSQNTALGAFSFGTLDFNTNIGYQSHSYGTSNTTLGENSTAGTSAAPVSHSMAIGADASVTTNNTIVIGTNTDTVKIPKDMTVAVGLSANVVTVTGELRVPYLDSGLAGEWTLCITGTGVVYKCGHLGNNLATPGGTNETLSAQIQSQQKQMMRQQILIESLRKLVCAQNTTAQVCEARK
ncbi:MAG: hypothetical protein ABJA02_06570 [Acidobacteriota bacterium]